MILSNIYYMVICIFKLFKSKTDKKFNYFYPFFLINFLGCFLLYRKVCSTEFGHHAACSAVCYTSRLRNSHWRILRQRFGIFGGRPCGTGTQEEKQLAKSRNTRPNLIASGN